MKTQALIGRLLLLAILSNPAQSHAFGLRLNPFKAIESVGRAAVKTVECVVNVGEAAVQAIGGDDEGVRNALNRAGDNLDDAVKSAIDAAIPFEGELKEDIEKIRKKISGEIRNGSRKVGATLEVAAQPENMGKIAFIYSASMIAGPLGSSFANVLYDKIVLKKDLSDEDMLKSFAIGAAAGYAAEGVQAGIEGGEVFNSFQHSSYLSKAASNVTRNLVTDAGNIVLNNQSYTTRDMLISVASGMSVVEIGNSHVSAVIETTLEGGLSSVATQAVANDFDLSEIDYDKVEAAIYNGLAYGITREVVHAIVDATLLEALPEKYQRVDKQLFAALKDAFYEIIVHVRSEELEIIQDRFSELSRIRQSQIVLAAQSLGEKLAEDAAQEVFGKHYFELTPEEILNESFISAYERNVQAAHYAYYDSEEIQNVRHYFESEASNSNLREPSAAIVPLFLIALSAYGTYNMISGLHELKQEYDLSLRQGKSFNQFVEENKFELAMSGADVLLAAAPALSKVFRAGYTSIKGLNHIVFSSQRLGMVDDIAENVHLLARWREQYKAVLVQSADDVNRILSSRYPKPPYTPGKSVVTFRTHEPETWVRVFKPGVSGRQGAWMMKAEDIRGMTPKQIQQRYALPAEPTRFSVVTPPTSTTIRMGEASRNFGQPGGGIQYELVDMIPDNSFAEGKAIEELLELAL